MQPLPLYLSVSLPFSVLQVQSGCGGCAWRSCRHMAAESNGHYTFYYSYIIWCMIIQRPQRAPPWEKSSEKFEAFGHCIKFIVIKKKKCFSAFPLRSRMQGNMFLGLAHLMSCYNCGWEEVVLYSETCHSLHSRFHALLVMPGCQGECVGADFWTLPLFSGSGWQTGPCDHCVYLTVAPSLFFSVCVVPS